MTAIEFLGFGLIFFSGIVFSNAMRSFDEKEYKLAIVQLLTVIATILVVVFWRLEMYLERYSKVFNMRHEEDFDNDDIEILKERWPNIYFHDIPASWIVPIDEMLGRLRYSNLVQEIRQDYGQLVIIHTATRENHLKIIGLAEKLIKEIDGDLN